MKRGQLITLIVMAIVIFLFTLLKNQNKKPDRPEDPGTEEVKPNRKNDQDRPPSDNPNREEGFNRNVGPLIFTKHARCRMDCRHIDESEVKDILANGRINDRKSEPAGRPDPKYALEGRTRDGQEVRIIFAPSDRGMVVVTVIDLDTDWTCHCK